MIKHLIVYSMEGCASCVSAAKLLTSKGIQHTVVKIDEDLEAARFIKSKGFRSLPQIYNGDELIPGGFAGLKQYLGEK